MYSFALKDKILEFRTRENVFHPTQTSELLITSFQDYVQEPKKLLDLGCGSGVVSIALAKDGLATKPIYASDLSEEAVALTKENAKNHGCDVVAKAGSVFGPWRNEQFDCIIDDISGIAEEVAAISPWYPPDIPCSSGKDGTELVSQVIREASDYLKPNGLLFFPVLSLSNSDKIITTAKENFTQVQRLTHKKFVLPEEMKKHIDLLRRLNADKTIQIEEKLGLVLWDIEIYVAGS